MKLKEATRATLNTLSYDQVRALEDLKDTMILSWANTSFKKDTEFDTIWAVASYEAKAHALSEFIQTLFNPPETSKTR